MSPEVVKILISAAITVGEAVAHAIVDALAAGDVDAVKSLAAVLPNAHQLALEDAALRNAQRAKAGL